MSTMQWIKKVITLKSFLSQLTTYLIYIEFSMGKILQIIVIAILLRVQAYALEIGKVYHLSRDLFYVNPAMGEIKLRTTHNNLTEAYTIINGKKIKMDIIYRDKTYDYFLAETEPFDTTVYYYFILKDLSDSLHYPTAGSLKVEAPLFNPPAWAMGKTYYIIAPDGFYNGHIANDPKRMLKWGEPPRGWLSYGGDLRGIIDKLPYVDSLNPDIIMLLPIFKSSSNHKFDVEDYAAIDPTLGDTADLRLLIDEIHRRNKKIVLWVVFSHTGHKFPAFIDINKNGANSKYINWYQLSTPTIKKSPLNYGAWLNDYRFPRLNLKNGQLKSYLIRYLEYWKHFGFDGFYIGEDLTIESSFVKSLSRYMKSKYPDMLLLGSDCRSLNGEGFDGCKNTRFRKLLLDYFLRNQLSTSEFDAEIRKLLFFSLSQMDCTNLISLFSYDKRVASIAPDKTSLKNLYVFLFTFCGSPAILYGDETGMAQCSMLNWGSFIWQPEKQDRELLDLIKRLIKIKRENPQFASKNFYTLYVNDINRIYAYDRGGIIVVINSGNAHSFVELPAWDGNYIDLMSGEKFTAFSQKLRFSISPNSFRILKRGI